MSLYDDASLIMFPSGYKEDKIYSLKPTDGSGDLTFTRASTATRVNADGLIETASVLGTELISSTLINSNYDTFNEASVSGFHAIYSTSGTQRAGTLDEISFVTGKTYQVNIDVSVVSGSAPFLRAREAIATSPTIFSGQLVDGSNVVTFTSTNTLTGILEFSSTTASEYRVSNVSVKEVITLNVPRIDYTGGGCGKLLLEPQRSNVCLWSEQIDNAGWTKGNSPTITTNIATAADGTVSADGIQDTTGGTFKRIRQNISVSANSTNTASVFIKKETTQTNFGGLALTCTGGTTKYAYGIINPITGTIVVSTDSNIASSSTKVEDFGDWWRFSLTATDNGSNTTLEIAYYATLSTNGTSAGAGAGSVRTVWGFQVEIGASYATSYIPTLASSVTRLADEASKTGISSLIGQTEGTIFMDFIAETTTTSQSHIWLGAVGSEIGVYGASSFQFYSSGGVNIGGGAFVTGQRYKIAFAYKENDYVAYVNGVQKGTDTSATVPTTSAVYINSYSDFSEIQKKQINQTILFPTRLTNTQLATLTTI